MLYPCIDDICPLRGTILENMCFIKQTWIMYSLSIVHILYDSFPLNKSPMLLYIHLLTLFRYEGRLFFYTSYEKQQSNI